MTTTARADKKPPFMPQWLWDASACPNSPTGSHRWLLESYKVHADTKGCADGPCAYCPKMYSDVYSGKHKKQRVKVDPYGVEHELLPDSRAARIEEGL